MIDFVTAQPAGTLTLQFTATLCPYSSVVCETHSAADVPATQSIPVVPPSSPPPGPPPPGGIAAAGDAVSITTASVTAPMIGPSRDTSMDLSQPSSGRLHPGTAHGNGAEMARKWRGPVVG